MPKHETYRDVTESATTREIHPVPLEDYGVIVHGVDNFPTRYLLNNVSVMLRKPMVHGSLYRFEGETPECRLLYDALYTSFTEVKPRRNPPGPSCGDDAKPSLLSTYEDSCTITGAH